MRLVFSADTTPQGSQAAEEELSLILAFLLPPAAAEGGEGEHSDDVYTPCGKCGRGKVSAAVGGGEAPSAAETLRLSVTVPGRGME